MSPRAVRSDAQFYTVAGTDSIGEDGGRNRSSPETGKIAAVYLFFDEQL